MSNVLAIQEPRGVVATMADKFSMRADTFEAMVRAQCSPAPKRGEEAVPLTREEFAAFILVANNYDLNPLLREIYAYPKRGGGIIPVVSVDGWISLINRQPSCDGYDLVATLGSAPNAPLISYTCTMYRKDRSHPVVVTEFLSECYRETEPWKMKHRMLRHKSLIQAGRYAFGFSGIYDQDEAERIAASDEARDMRRAPAPTSHVATIEHKPAVAMERAVETRDPIVASGPQTPSTAAQRRPPAPPGSKAASPSPAFDFAAHKARAVEALAKAPDFDACDDVFAKFAQNRKADLTDAQYTELRALVVDRQEAFEPAQRVEWTDDGDAV